MYEGFYGLNKRPFSSVPHPDSFVGLEPAQEALEGLITCISQARGIGVITSSAGLGKTLLCKRLAAVSQPRFQSVYLSTSAFATRRALLQAILYEFGIAYEGLTEQEARLKILEAARAIASEGKLLLLIVDEAHLLGNRLFEELRTLADYAPEGEALIRLVLSGQFELEEKLADPAMSAIHQRIGCQVCLDSLSLTQSAELLIKRLQWAGAEDILSILTEPAIEAICRASDGNPRCLCQLADHSFLLAFTEEQMPVERNTVLAALEDLKELPLHWNDIHAEEDDIPIPDPIDQLNVDQGECETDEFEIPEEIQEQELADDAETETIQVFDPDETADFRMEDLPVQDDVHFNVIEVGAELPDLESANLLKSTTSLTSQHIAIPLTDTDDCSDVEEIEVVDKYAKLDQIAEQALEFSVPVEEQSATEAEEHVSPLPEIASEKSQDFECSILDAVEELRREIGHAVEESRLEIQRRQMDHDLEDALDLDPAIGSPEHEIDIEMDQKIRQAAEQTRLAETIKEIDTALPSSESKERHSDTEESEQTPPPRFSQLFTRLRKRREKVRAEQVRREAGR